MRKSLRKKGFTLVEVMSTVAILGALTALSIPNLLRERINTNEAAAQATLKTINFAMESYRLGNATYPCQLSELAGTTGTTHLDEAVASGLKSGYRFQITSADKYTYRVTATPQNPTITGSRLFVLTESGTIQDGGLVSSPTGGTGSPNFPPAPECS